MAALRRLDGPTDVGLGDHVCWTFADARDFAAVVLPYLDEGRLRGEQLLLIGGLVGARPLVARCLGLFDVPVVPA